MDACGFEGGSHAFKDMAGIQNSMNEYYVHYARALSSSQISCMFFAWATIQSDNACSDG